MSSLNKAANRSFLPFKQGRPAIQLGGGGINQLSQLSIFVFVSGSGHFEAGKTPMQWTLITAATLGQVKVALST